jgi:hypothetical protein
MEGTAMAVMDYWTQDGHANYGFSIEFQPDKGWRVYIVFRPLYQDKSNSSKLPHQTTDDSGRSYVNWPARIDSLGDAKTVAALWAENTERYTRERICSNDEAKSPSSINQRRPRVAA